MGILKRLLKGQKKSIEQSKNNEVVKLETEWQELPAFVKADESEYKRVSLIATAIAAGDQPKDQFVVKKIMKRNAEVRLVSLIAASLAANSMNESHLKVKRIAKKK